MKSNKERRIVGSDKFRYEEIKGWGNLPEDWAFVEVPGVAVDSQDRVYVLCRTEPPVLVLDREGRFLKSWGEELFKRPHSIFIGPADNVYCVDDWGHAVHKFTTNGELLMTIETASHPADTGYVWDAPSTVQRAGPPFNYPTAVALSPKGELYVSDGYGNARVHKFAPDGRLLFSWGEPGSGPGEFVTPHNVCVDREGLVYVADRQNCRIQVFGPQGEFITQWAEIWWPCDMCVDADGYMYVAEVGGIFMGAGEPKQSATGARGVPDDAVAPDRSKPPARITVRDLTGTILAEWSEEDPFGTGMYFSPHGITIDSKGNLYVGEVATSYTHGAVPEDWGVLRKYERS